MVYANNQRFIGVLAGRGGFNLTSPEVPGYSVGASPWNAIPVDLDNDGRTDLVTADSGSQNLSWLSNLGAGTFAVPKLYTIGGTHGALCDTMTDLNGDLLACDSVDSGSDSASIDVFLTSGNGNMKVPTTLATARASVPFWWAT